MGWDEIIRAGTTEILQYAALQILEYPCKTEEKKK